MIRYLVKRPKNTVEVLILPNKDGSGYQYVNLIKGHICPCKFATVNDALKDMINREEMGTITSFQQIGDLEVKPC